MAEPGSSLLDKQKFADLLFDGEYLPGNLFKKITSQTITPIVEIDIREAVDYMERVQIVERTLPTSDMRDEFKLLNDAFKKDEELAKILFKRGDEKSARDVAGSLRYYNLALFAVPTTGTKIGEIYRRRAAMSLKLTDHESCLKNVEMALKYKIQPKMKGSIREIHTKLIKICSRKMDQNAGDYSDKVERKMYRDDVMYRVDGPSNPKIPVAAECINVAYNKDKGRHVVTTADLAPGKTIIVEDPYVNILENCLLWNTQHCAACCKRSSCLIPCDCMFVMYCDEKCRVNAMKNGHLYECKCMPQLHALQTNWLSQAAFVTICKAGPDELRDRYMASKNKMLPISEEEKGFNPDTGVYETNSYYQISKLHTCLDKAALPALTMMSVILTRVLDFNTNFFHAEPEGPERNGFISYVASRILLHSTSFGVNSFGLIEKVADKSYPLNLKLDLPSKEEGLSSALYPFISLLEHSCYPNTMVHYLTNGRMAIITNRLIKAGEEVSISYKYSYWRDEAVHRRARLNYTYHFFCNCIPCRYHWPKINTYNGFLCQNCSGDFHYDEMFKRCVVTSFKDGNGMCPNCKGEINLKNMQSQIDYYDDKHSAACELVIGNKPLPAIPLILDCIKFFQRNVCPPCPMLVNSTILLGEAYGMI